MPKVYDCFMFFNETELTELRIRELDPVVDEFVIVEAAHTHTNKPKDFIFGKEVTSGKYDDIFKKLNYITIPEFPEGMTSLERENFQRNQIMQGLSNLHDLDTVIISDCDEIPYPVTVDQYHLQYAHPMVVQQDYFCYYLNCKTPHQWRGTVLTRGSDLKRNNPQWMRDNKDAMRKLSGGWHFGYLGGLERIQTKMVSFLHEEFADLPREHLAEKLEKKEDLYQNVPFEVVAPEDCDLPKYVMSNLDRFQHLIHT